MRELILQLNCIFTDDDKEQCIPTIYKIIELAKLARMEGLLALERETEQEQSFFLKTGLHLVTDGTDPVIVKQILQNMILADKYSGSHLLSRLLTAEGILALQQGENPYIIALKLSSMLGEKYILPITETFSSHEDRIRLYFNFLNTLEDKKSLPESIPFEIKISHLDNRSIQHIICNTDRQDLTMALHGCGVTCIRKILDNVSMTTCLQICEDLKLFNPLSRDYVLFAQEKVLENIRTLENRGEIVTII